MRDLAARATATLFFFLLAALPGYGCAPALEAVRPSESPSLAMTPLRSVTVMPLDLMMEAEEPMGVISAAASERAAGRALEPIANAVDAALAQHGYLRSRLDWDGTLDGPGGRLGAMNPSELAELSSRLLGYGFAVMNREAGANVGFGPLPFASDATLYVGGFAHLHRDRPHRTELAIQIGIGVAVAVAVAALVVALVVTRGQAARLLVLPLKVGAEVAMHAPQLLQLGARVALDVAAHLPSGSYRSSSYRGGAHDRVDYEAAARARPAELSARQPNELALSATLIDNRTGEVLWTAGLPAAIDPVDDKELRYAVGHLLAQLPRARY